MWSVTPLLLVSFFLSPRGASGNEADVKDETETETKSEDDRKGDDEDEGDWTLTFAPAKVLYPAYIADPRRPTFSLALIEMIDTNIDAVSDQFFGVRMGVRYAILQLHREGDPDGGLELAGDVAYFGLFDWENSTDNVGWDGLYGFHVAWAALPRLVVRAGASHFSSHLGDEYIEETGRERIEYTREEFLGGVRWTPWDALGGYAEYGHAYDLRNEDLMEEGRAQAGLEWQPEPMIWHERLAPYAALDVSAYEENDWDENLTVQVGIVRPGAGRGGAWRMGFEYYDGRSTLGEFFQDDEQYIALGLWLDL